jgi:gliding-associated putative ABC transporter substrate-binding component GldG
MLRDEPDRRQFAKGPQPVAVLLEGEFTSNFKNRIPTQITNNPDIAFKDLSTPNKMVVISDGDIIKNDYKPSTDQFSALGYDKYTNRVYGNKDFLLNTFNYLLDDSGLIDSRSKEFKIRLLDPEKSKIQKEKYQIINTVLPVILIVFLGLLQFISRKRKYGKIKK